MWFANVVLGATFLLSTVCGQVYGPKELPVGAFFDHDEKEINTGFRYKVQYDGHQNDNKHSSVKLDLDKRVAFIDTGDAFAVSEQVCDFLEKGIFVLFGSHRVDTIETLRSYSKTFHMPYITTSMAYNESDQHRGYQLYMQPYYMKALLVVCKSKQWKNVMYIYDSDEGLARIHQMYGEVAMDGYPLTMDLYRVTSPEEAYDVLTKWSHLDNRPTNILLDLPTSDCDVVFGMATNTTVLLSFNFLLVGLGIGELSFGEFKEHGGFNVTGFSMIDSESSHYKKFLESWQALSEQMYPGAGQATISYQAALAVDAVGVIQTALSKVLVDRSDIFNANWKKDRFFNNKTEGIHCDADDVMPWEHGHEIMKKIGEIDYVGMTGPVKFDSFRLRKDYKLYLYEVRKSRGYNQIGEWISRRGLDIKRKGIRGVRPIENEHEHPKRPLVIISILGQPYLEKREGVPGLTGNDQYSGYCADLAYQLAGSLKMDYEIRVVKDGKFGSKEDDGSWNGMVGELVRREADIAVAPLTITSERETVIDFSKPFMSLGISIMVKKMTKETPGVFSFMYPLSYEIWMCVIFAYIGVSVVLFLVSRFSPFEWHIEDNTEGPTVTNNFTIFNSLWFSLGAFMQQGCDIEPRSMSGRIVGSVWWFFTLIIISSYTANLAAFLTVQRMTSPIESAEDLAKQTEIKYGTIDSGTTKGFFRSSTIPVYNRMWTFMDSSEPSVFVSTNKEGVDRVRKSDGKYAFLMESTTNEYQNQQEPCDTMKVGANLDSKGYGIATPVGSPWRDEITLAILEFREQGLLSTLQKTWWYEKGACGKEASKESTNSLKLGNVAGIFYILTTGLLLALVMAVIEFLYKSKMEARRRKTSFTNAVRTKARLSIKGKPERQTTAYTYAPAAQLISLDGYGDGANTHTQV